MNQKSYESLTVQEIIDLADVGRSTFYAHFETKEALLEEMCQDLFQHTFVERYQASELFDATAHIFYHFRKNQDKIATLLLSKNIYFINRLKLELEHYLFPLIREKLLAQKSDLPEPFLKTMSRQLLLKQLLGGWDNEIKSTKPLLQPTILS